MVPDLHYSRRHQTLSRGQTRNPIPSARFQPVVPFTTPTTHPLRRAIRRRRRMESLKSKISAAPPPDPGAPVLLNVYDLTPMNDYMRWFGIGIYHSGIEVHGSEYGYGAHDLPASGVFEVEPKSCPGFVYRCSVQLGHTNMLPSEFRSFMENMAADYHGDTYHLLTKNCNHFTDDVSMRVTGRQIPGWVNRLAQLGVLCNCLLPDSLRIPAVKQTPEYYGLSEDGGETCSVITSNEPPESDEDKHLLSSSSGGDVGHVVFVKETHR